MLKQNIENNNYKCKIKELFQLVDCFDIIEKKHIESAIDWIDSGTEIIRIEKPAIPKKHLVCFMVLFDDKSQKILLFKHKDSGLILPSGGHVEKGEMPHETARRELFEELGIDRKSVLKDCRLPFFISQVDIVRKTSKHIDVDLWYLLEGDSREPIKTDSLDFEREFGGYKWYTINEIFTMPLEILDPNMYRFAEKLKKYFL